MNRFFQFLILVVLAASLISCASLTRLFMTEKKCKAINAYGYGQKTALQVMSLNTFNEHKKICADKHQISLNQAEFDKGYRQGIKEYGKKLALQQISLNTFNEHNYKAIYTEKKDQVSVQAEFDKGYKQGIKEYGKKLALQQISLNTFNEHNYKAIYTEKKDQVSVQAEFDKGYKQGIKELCTDEGGYNFGLQGLIDKKICPKKKKKKFIKGYTKGRVEYLERKISTMYESCDSCCPACVCDPCDSYDSYDSGSYQ